MDYIVGSFGKSIILKPCEDFGTADFFKITLEELKEICDVKEVFAFLSKNDKAIRRKLDDSYISYTLTEEKIDLDPRRGDTLYIINPRNFQALGKDEIPKNIVVEVLVMKTYIKGSEK